MIGPAAFILYTNALNVNEPDRSGTDDRSGDMDDYIFNKKK